MIYACAYSPSHFHAVAGCMVRHTIHTKPTNCLQGYPSHRWRCLTFLLPSNKALLPTYNKMLSLSAPLLSCTLLGTHLLISPVVTRAEGSARFLPSRRSESKESALAQVPPHNLPPQQQAKRQVEERGQKRGDRRKRRPRGPEESRTDAIRRYTRDVRKRQKAEKVGKENEEINRRKIQDTKM